MDMAIGLVNGFKMKRIYIWSMFTLARTIPPLLSLSGLKNCDEDTEVMRALKVFPYLYLTHYIAGARPIL